MREVVSFNMGLVEDICFELMPGDIEEVIYIVSQLQNASCAKLVDSVMDKMDALLGFNGSILGVYCFDLKKNEIISTAVEDCEMATFESYPSSLHCVLSILSGKNEHTVFFEKQKDQ